MIALSLVNLCYLRVWTELLTYTRADEYEMKLPPGPADYLAAMANVLLGGAVLFAAVQIARRAGIRQRLLNWGFLLFLILPLNSIRTVLSEQFAYLRSPLFEVLGTKGVALLAIGLTASGVSLMVRWSSRLASAAAAVLVVVSPLVPMTLAQAAWKAAHYSPAPLAPRPLAPAVAGTPPRRVLWVIFDEWDQRLTFRERSPLIQLPELDRFRAASLSASNAYSPGPETSYSMPALITGRMVADFRKVDPDTMLVKHPGLTEPVDWGREQNIFADARQAGFNTAVVGWYHPYCRAIAWSLTDCAWWELESQHNSMGVGFFSILVNQARSLFETSLFSPFGQSLATAHHGANYGEMLARAKQELARRDLGLTLLHLPVPHAPHAYNMRTGRFDLANAPIRGYLDSLVLTDRTLGEIRRTMERLGTWNTTTILLSADHSFRAAPALDHKKDHRVPFLLKMEGHNEPVAFDAPFNTLLTHDLLLAILRGEVSTPVQAAGWLDRHRTIADSPYNCN